MRDSRVDWVKLILDRFLWLVIVLIALFFVWRAPGFATGVKLRQPSPSCQRARAPCHRTKHLPAQR